MSSVHVDSQDTYVYSKNNLMQGYKWKQRSVIENLFLISEFTMVNWCDLVSKYNIRSK